MSNDYEHRLVSLSEFDYTWKMLQYDDDILSKEQQRLAEAVVNTLRKKLFEVPSKTRA